MGRAPRSRRGFVATVVGVALFGAVGAPGPAVAQDVPPDSTGAPGPRTALVLFVSYRGNLAVPIHPTRARQGASSRVATALADLGRSVVSVPELEPLMRRHRLRSERDLSLEFLQDLAHDFSVEELIVARLVTYDDRILLLGRALSVDGGWLRWANVVEEESSGNPWADEASAIEQLGTLVGAAGRHFLPAKGAVASGATPEGLVPLPLTSSGLGRGDSDLAMVCLLRALLGAGRWIIPDPSLVVSELQRGGMDPYLLGAGARERLVSGFRSRRLLAPALTSFPAAAGPSGGARIPGDEAFDRPADWVRRQPPALFTVTLIDGESGELLAGRAEYLRPDNKTGIFGRARKGRLSRRYEESAELLVRSLVEIEGST